MELNRRKTSPGDSGSHDPALLEAANEVRAKDANAAVVAMCRKIDRLFWRRILNCQEEKENGYE